MTSTYKLTKITCSCGNSFSLNGAFGTEHLHIETCSACHRFYTKQSGSLAGSNEGKAASFQHKFADLDLTSL